jgi:DNA polymerase III epsilon subunit-like protein
MEEDLMRYDDSKTLVFIDCETLNLCLNFCHNLPWQIAMLKVKGKKILAEKDYYIKWDTHLRISEDAARITRYSQSKIDKDGLTPEEVFPTIKDWLDNADYIVGHNVLGFDLYLIKGYYEYMGEDYHGLTEKIIDTNCLARADKFNMPYSKEAYDSLLEYQYKLLYKRQKGVKTNLTALGKEYDIDHDYDNLHNALVDLELNVKVWQKLKWKVEI